jgi:hypothetical protein
MAAPQERILIGCRNLLVVERKNAGVGVGQDWHPSVDNLGSVDIETSLNRRAARQQCIGSADSAWKPPPAFPIVGAGLRW